MDSSTPTPTCEHGKSGKCGQFIGPLIEIGGKMRRNQCPGPVIATPKKCLDCGHQTPHADELVYCEIAGCNCDRTSVSTEAQTPVSEVWAMNYHDAVRLATECGQSLNGRGIEDFAVGDPIFRFVKYVQTSVKLGIVFASDPSSELRERIESAERKIVYAIDLEIENPSPRLIATVRNEIQALLVVLVEPK